MLYNLYAYILLQSKMSSVSHLLVITIMMLATVGTSPMAEAHSFVIHTRLGNRSATHHAFRQRLHQKRLSHTPKARPGHLEVGRVFPALPSGMVYVSALIGTPPLRINLALDILFPFTWVQPIDCHGHCFNISSPYSLFDPKKSTTFKLLPPHNPLCSPPFAQAGPFCAYDIYQSRGVYGIDELHLLSPSDVSSGSCSTKRIAFGCSYQSWVDFDAGWNFNILGGILGLGKGHPSSIVTQLGTDRFSYCLPGRSDSNSTGQPTLNFGSEASIDASANHVQTTPITSRPKYNHSSYLTMVSVTVNGEVVYVTPENSTETKLVLLDVADSQTYFAEDAYYSLQDGIASYFAKTYGWKVAGLELPRSYIPCFDLPTKLTGIVFPKVAIELLGGASLELHDVFKIFPEENLFCMAIMESFPYTSVGVYQQMGYRFLYDLAQNKLSFAPNMC